MEEFFKGALTLIGIVLIIVGFVVLFVVTATLVLGFLEGFLPLIFNFASGLFK